MAAPLYDALRALSAQNTARFHMPGHKGAPDADFPFALDYTETYGTGNLYTEEGPIREAERAAARFYGAPDCLFLTGGSSQGVMAMLAACGTSGAVLIDRSCHRSVCHALALLGLRARFVAPPVEPTFGCSLAVTAEAVAAALTDDCRAVLLTTPNYYGIRTPLSEIAALCRARGIPLLVDCAHGAHFPALGLPTPLDEGATACVMSAHKTLPALGQAALLLTDGTLPGLRECTRLMGTSSPSYPILASLDRTLDRLDASAWRETAAACDRLRDELLRRTPYLPLTSAEGLLLDPTRLTVSTAGVQQSGFDLADALYERFGVAVEMADERSIVCIVTPTDRAENLDRLLEALALLGETAPARALPPPLVPFPLPRTRCTVREAWFAPRETLPLESARGRICARPITPYPPGVPLLYPGEEIDTAQIDLLRERCYTMVEVMRAAPD